MIRFVLLLVLLFSSVLPQKGQAEDFHEHEIDFILERSAYVQRPGIEPHWFISENNMSTLHVIEHECHTDRLSLDLDWFSKKVFSADAKTIIFLKTYLPTTFNKFLFLNPTVLFDRDMVWSVTPPSERVEVFRRYLVEVLNLRGKKRFQKYQALSDFVSRAPMHQEERELYQSILGERSIDSIKPNLIECIIDLSGLSSFQGLFKSL